MGAGLGVAVLIGGCSSPVQHQGNRGRPVTYYVNGASGSDSANGTSPSTAWRSLAKVDSTMFGPGDRLLFARGEVWRGRLHPLGSGAPGDPVVVGAYGSGGDPTIDGGSLAGGPAILLENQSDWTIEKLAVVNNSGGNNFGSLELPGMSREGVLVEDSGGGIESGVTLRDLSVTSVNGCFSCSDVDSHLNGGIVAWASKSGDSFDGLVIDDNRVSKVGRSGIVVWDQSYYRTDPLEVDVPELSTGVRIVNNSVTRVDGDGIITLGTYGAVVDGNVVDGAAQKSIGGSSEAASVGIMTTRAVGTLVEHNEVFNTLTEATDGEGIDADLGSIDTTIEYNYSHHNQGGFLLAMGGFSRSLVVRYNLSVDDSYGGLKGVFTFDGSQGGSLIYNNTVYVPKGSPANVMVCQNCSSVTSTTWSFVNNIVENLGSGGYLIGQGRGATVDRNVFFGNHPSSQLSDAHAITLDPKLRSPGRAGTGMRSAVAYRISPGSPAAGSGSVIANNGGEDFFGDPLPLHSAPSRGFAEPERSSRASVG